VYSAPTDRHGTEPAEPQQGPLQDCMASKNATKTSPGRAFSKATVCPASLCTRSHCKPESAAARPGQCPYISWHAQGRNQHCDAHTHQAARCPTSAAFSDESITTQRPARMQPFGEGTKKPRQIAPAPHPPRSSLPPTLRKRPYCPHARLHATFMYTWIARTLTTTYSIATARAPSGARACAHTSCCIAVSTVSARPNSARQCSYSPPRLEPVRHRQQLLH